jgi:DNA ligase-1
MNKIKAICDELQATNSVKEKETILRREQENLSLIEIIYFLLNPYIVSGLSKKKINKNVGIIPNVNYKELISLGDDPVKGLINLLNYIKKNNTGRDIDISVCEMYFTNFDNEMQKFIKSILTKSLKLGISDKTANKVWSKDFIPSFECMLADKYFEKPEKVEGKAFSITLKIDGQRCLAVKKNDEVLFYSREGQLIEGLIDIENEILNIPADNFVLDGELTLLDGKGIPSKEQYKQTEKITRKDGEKHGIKLLTFDILDLAEFTSRRGFNTYSQRRRWLERLSNDIIMKYVEILPVLYCGYDTSKIKELHDLAKADNQEGIMININDATYQFKRTDKLLKCKVMQTCDLKIVGFEEGSGRLSGTLGRINVEYKNSIVGVGSGFSDNDRKYFWEHQSELLDRVITVQYFEETEDKNGIKSLRFPVFEELRDIDKEVSYY